MIRIVCNNHKTIFLLILHIFYAASSSHNSDMLLIHPLELVLSICSNTMFHQVLEHNIIYVVEETSIFEAHWK